MLTVNKYVNESIGYRTSRYVSENLYSCPRAEVVRENERMMHEIIDDFFSQYRPMPLELSRDDYINTFKLVSGEYGLDTSRDPKEYLEIDMTRSVECILQTIVPDSRISEILLIILKEVEAAECSKLARTLFISLYLICNHGRTVEDIIKKYPELSKYISELIELHSAITSNDVLLSKNQAETLVRISKIQERPFTERDLVMSNILLNHTELMDILMNFHQSLFEYAIRTIQKNPEWLELQLNRPLNEVFAYSEDGKICANPKLLRVFANNLIPSIAKYFTDEDITLTKDKLIQGIEFMKSAGLFQTMIFDFSLDEERVRLNGIIPTVCPAKTFLPNAMINYINSI